VRLLVSTFERNGTGAYNAGSGVSVGIGQIVDIINTLLPRPKELVSRGESRPQEVMDVAADIEKAGRELDWKPAVDMVSGLRLMMEATPTA
jgi:nucleoside-diphosphate-sugar epimerase